MWMAPRVKDHVLWRSSAEMRRRRTALLLTGKTPLRQPAWSPCPPPSAEQGVKPSAPTSLYSGKLGSEYLWKSSKDASTVEYRMRSFESSLSVILTSFLWKNGDPRLSRDWFTRSAGPIKGQSRNQNPGPLLWPALLQVGRTVPWTEVALTAFLLFPAWRAWVVKATCRQTYCWGPSASPNAAGRALMAEQTFSLGMWLLP